MIEKFWLQKADLYSKEGFEINELGTHPHLIKIFNKYCPQAKKILDYGCGDGALIKKMQTDFELSLYDISSEMLEIAKKQLETYNPLIYENVQDIPRKYFDCIFISMVFICVPTEKDFQFIIEKVSTLKEENGYILVANPHPCFRDKAYSSYYTEYSIGKNFGYFDNGDRHKLFLRDKAISFYDYNWSLAFLLNSFLNKGLQLVELVEIKDNETNSFYNDNFSPSIIYVFK